MKLAIISTHPIQYNAPFFRLLNEHQEIGLVVYYTQPTESVRFDPDFKRQVEWDVDLKSGYIFKQHDATTRSGKAKLLFDITESNHDAVLIYGWNFPGHLFIMRKLKGRIPIWFRGDSHLLDPMPRWRRWIRIMILSWVYRNVDHCFSVGTHNEAYFQACGIPSNQISRAPHAVDNAWFAAHNMERQRAAQTWRDELGIPKTHQIVLFAGKLEIKKQPRLLIEAWQRIEQPDCHLIIAGSGELESDIQQECGHLSNLHFIGFQNQSSMPILYRMADVFCLPSKGPNETWGLAINEALACGTPCIASSQVGCAEDIFIQPDLGCAFESRNALRLQDALEHQLKGPHPSMESLKLFRETFSYDAFVEQILPTWKMTTT